ncbi:LTA synthase family protein [Pseudomonas citronellolis]|uniref:LTA synthase family protein n=1 Tax=Pseudomonas citronellolis TaxID=53408 RepID=UPI00264903D4|nr:LTA synthase family protein [Pseudomonas citronellolis]MDN6874681.1 LTA synthase family protein [Pseudomonas citronellolis]
MLARIFKLSVSIIAISVFSWWLDRYSMGLQLNSYLGSDGFWANSLPLIACLALLLAITNRLLFSTVCVSLLSVVFYLINKEKLIYLDKVISLQDFMFLQELDLSLFRLLGNYVDMKLLLAGFVIGLASLVALYVLDRRFFLKGSKMRGGVLLSSFVLVYGVVSGASVLDHIYDYGRLRLAWTNEESELHAGLLSTLIFNNIKQRTSMDEPVDMAAVSRVIKRYPPVSTGSLPRNDARPDIIVIQSESFFDPSVLNGVRGMDALIPNFRRVIGEGRGGEMRVPTFGGGTLRTEFEVLTGIPLAAYPRMEFPYMQANVDSLQTIASDLGEYGYKTIAVHGNKGAFWNREKTFAKAGFDQFLTIEKFPEEVGQEGWFASDQAMTDVIIRQLSSDEKPKFIFSISIEGHGPYTNSPVRNKSVLDSIETPAGLSDGAANEYKNYVYHIHNADAELGRLLSFLENRGRPYVLAFYGDHLPGFSYIYNEMSFKNGEDAPHQPVPWIIVSNNSSPRSIHVPQSWMLGGLVLREAGYRGGRYFGLTRKVAQTLDNGGDITKNMLISDFLSVARLQMTGRLGEILETTEAGK